MVFEGKENHEVYEALNSSCKYTWKYTRFHFCFINRNASFNLFKPKVVLKTTKILKKENKAQSFCSKLFSHESSPNDVHHRDDVAV